MDGWLFWGTSGAMVLAVAVALLSALRRRHGGGAPAAAYDIQVYRDQFAEIDRDVARGTLAPEDADRLRTEVSRRVLGADRAMTAAPVSNDGARGIMAALIVAALAGGVWGYLRLGAPGYRDIPLSARIAAAEERRANRPAQAQAEALVALPAPATSDAEFAGLMKRLRDAVRQRPDDLQGLALLARNEASLGNFTAARAAQEALIATKGTGVMAQDHADLAEIMIAAAGGYVSPEAEDVLEQALTLDAENGTARYYAGLMLGQVGRYDLGFRLWQPLVDDPTDAPWLPALRAQIEDMALRAGVEFTLPPPSGLTPEGMVAQLSDRLANEGGPPEDWARLIMSLHVLGKADQASVILTEARTVFAGNAAALSIIEAAAR